MNGDNTIECKRRGRFVKKMEILAFTGLTIGVGLGLCQIVTPCVGLLQIVMPSPLPDIVDSDLMPMRRQLGNKKTHTQN